MALPTRKITVYPRKQKYKNKVWTEQNSPEGRRLAIALDSFMKEVKFKQGLQR